MQKASNFLIILSIILLVLSVGYTFYKTVIQNDFEIHEEEMIDENIDTGSTDEMSE
jgi:uncharacterized protein YpmB